MKALKAKPTIEWISRAEVARRLAVSPMAVTKFCRYGMPHRYAEGKVCWPDVLFWSDLFRAPTTSGSWRARHPDYDEVEEAIDEAARELRRPRVQAWYQLYKLGMDATSVANRAIARDSVGPSEVKQGELRRA